MTIDRLGIADPMTVVPTQGLSSCGDLTLGLLAIVAAGMLYFRYGALPEPLAPGLESAQRLAPGPYEVASLDHEFEDTSRPTQANGDFPGAESRTLRTRLWYPANARSGQGVGETREPMPLLLYSHGFMSQRTGAAYLNEHLASHGFLVAAMDFPLTHYDAPGGPLIDDLVHQPEDVRFVLDRLLAWSEDPESRFFRAIDETRIGALGLSLGGATTTLLAWHPRHGDPRIAAAVSIAGPAFMFGERFFASRQGDRDLPFMMLAGDIDAIVPYESNARHLHDRAPGALLVTLASASHTGFAGPARHMRWLRNPDRVGCYTLRHGREEATTGGGVPWHRRLGRADEGILDVPAPPICTTDPLPEAMNPVHQHRLTKLAVRAFFESHFAAAAHDRRRSAQYLRRVMPRELPEVRVAYQP